MRQMVSRMAIPNPAIDPPRLEAPGTRASHSRSPSRSPVRLHARSFDPLLRDLSPTATLRAFKPGADGRREDNNDALGKSAEAASEAEREWGARAAQTCLDVRSWTREVEEWEWPRTFEPPEPARKKLRLSTMSFATLGEEQGGTPEEDIDEAFWGCLPAETVQHYESRAEAITTRLDQVDIDGLKEYALDAHGKGGSSKLDDFTVVVTATVLQALPYLSKLVQLLNVWTIRLHILRQVPSFLANLKRARLDLDHGWAALAVTPTSPTTSGAANFTRETMLELKTIVEKQVTSLGKTLDGFLDDLEGREELVPDTWIDGFEALEEAYGDWVVQAERKVLEDEWKKSHLAKLRASKESLRSAAASDTKRTLSPGVPEEFVEDRLGRSANNESLARPPSTTSNRSKSPYRQRHTPIILDYNSYDHPDPIQSITSDTQPRALTPLSAASLKILETPSAHSLQHSGSHSTSLSRPSAEPLSSKHSKQSLKSRASREQPSSQASQISLPAATAAIPAGTVQKRASFLNRAGTERTSSLQLTNKTPVRPFEHASNAFTKLFKNKTPESKRKDSAAKGQAGNGRRSVSVGRHKSFSKRFLGASPSDVDSEIVNRHAQTFANVSRDDTSNNPLSSGTPPLPLHEQFEDVAKDRPRTPERLTTNQLSSPFQSPAEYNVPDNWPLASPTKSSVDLNDKLHTDEIQRDQSGPALRVPSQICSSDVFDRTFVDSLPGSPEPNTHEPYIGHEARSPSPLRQEALVVERGGLKNGIPTVRASPEGTRKLTPMQEFDFFDLSHQDASLPTTPERSNSLPISIHDYAAPVQVAAVASYFPAQSSPVASHSGSIDESPQEVSQGNFDGSIHDPALHETRTPNPALSMGRPPIVDRASTASIESFPRSELKSVEVSRRGSLTSTSSRPQTPRSARPQSIVLDVSHIKRVIGTGSPMTYQNGMEFPRPPSVPVSPVSERSPAVTRESANQTSNSFAEYHVRSTREATPSTAAPPSLAMKKRRPNSNAPVHTGVSVRDGKDTVAGASPGPASPTSPTPGADALNSDSFDRHISEVLERVHAPIRFRSRPGANPPDLVSTLEPGRASLGSKAKLPGRGSLGRSSNAGGMTLAPAETSPQKSASAGQPEVKLYHLTQAGREEPIKLYVRLVGEKERVMVRVGGGWADLADYLRQYAEHHTSRTVSEGAVEVKALDNGGSRRVSINAAPRTSSTSTPTAPGAGASTPQARPGSNDSGNDENKPPRTPVEDQTPLATSPNVQSNNTALVHATPRSTLSSSRPTTADGSRPLSRQSTADNSGIAAPIGSGRKNDQLSERKAKWVEGMIEKAKNQSSAEKSKEKSFGDLGRVGSTRRVIFRSSSGVPGSGSGEK